MISVENALLQIEQGTLARERARLAAAEQLLDLVNVELAAAQKTLAAMAAISRSTPTEVFDG